MVQLPEELRGCKTKEKQSEKDVDDMLSTCVSNILVTCKSAKNTKAFITSNIKNYIDRWEQLTSDNTILTAVSG